MKVPTPHFLLFSQARTGAPECGVGQWRFVLESADGAARIEAADEEPATTQRLELLAIVRGLEALDQPSRVTLVTGSRYVSRGIRFGLSQWREDGWQWERYGEMSPIKDGDLWRRVDQALQFHEVDCQGPKRWETSDDLAVPILRVAPQPVERETGDVPRAQPAPTRRRRRGQNLRFDPAETPGHGRRSPRAARAPAWPLRLSNWLVSLLKRRQTTRGKDAIPRRKSLFR